MRLSEAIDFLLSCQQIPHSTAMAKKPQIMEAFVVFWGSRPSMWEFGAVMGGLYLFPEMLYVMAGEQLR